MFQSLDILQIKTAMPYLQLAVDILHFCTPDAVKHGTLQGTKMRLQSHSIQRTIRPKERVRIKGMEDEIVKLKGNHLLFLLFTPSKKSDRPQKYERCNNAGNKGRLSYKF
jgi:hypothetical protein